MSDEAEAEAGMAAGRGKGNPYTTRLCLAQSGIHARWTGTSYNYYAVAHGPWPMARPGLCFSIHLFFSVSARVCSAAERQADSDSRLLFGRGQAARTHAGATRRQRVRLLARLPCCRAFGVGPPAAGSGQHAVGRSNGQEPRRQAPQVSICPSLWRSGRTHARHAARPVQCSCDSGF